MQQRRVSGREGLREPGAVGVAVEVDRSGAEGPEPAGEVSRRIGGVEEIRGVDPRSVGAVPVVVKHVPAALDRYQECRRWLDPCELLERGAVDEGGQPGSAIIDEQKIAVGEQGCEEGNVQARASGRREPRSSLLGEDRGEPRWRDGGEPHESDVDRGRQGIAVVEGSWEGAAPGWVGREPRLTWVER